MAESLTGHPWPERHRLHTVDSWMQMIDRLIVAQLKACHYSADGRREEAAQAGEQADELSEAATRYLEECLAGNRLPRVHRHQTEEVKIASVMEAVSELAACHAKYWQAQGRVIDLRQRLPRPGEEVGMTTKILQDFRDADDAQRTCDGCNQLRNELIQKGDDLLRRMWDRGRRC